MGRRAFSLVLVLTAVFVPLAALRGETPLDKDFASKRSSIDDLASVGLYWLAHDFAVHGMSARGDELGKAALELAPDARKKEIKSRLASPGQVQGSVSDRIAFSLA